MQNEIHNTRMDANVLIFVIIFIGNFKSYQIYQARINRKQTE